MNRLDKHISIAKDMAFIKGHWLMNFKKTSLTTAVSHCRRCGAEARVNIDPPSFPVTDIREGDAFSGAPCDHRVKRMQSNPLPDPAVFGQKRREETFEVVRRSKKHNW